MQDKNAEAVEYTPLGSKLGFWWAISSANAARSTAVRLQFGCWSFAHFHELDGQKHCQNYDECKNEEAHFESPGLFGVLPQCIRDFPPDEIARLPQRIIREVRVALCGGGLGVTEESADNR